MGLGNAIEQKLLCFSRGIMLWYSCSEAKLCSELCPYILSPRYL